MAQAPPSAIAPFEVKDCALITRMSGVDSALNLRELRGRLRVCPAESIFHHFCEMQIRPTFDDPEFRNDFSVWASRDLRDRVLAERLGILDPYTFDDMEQLRARAIDIIEERLSEVEMIPWVPRGRDFRFMRAATIVFETGITLATLQDFLDVAPRLTPTSVYYHFIEARRRRDGRIDDFSHYLQHLPARPRELLDDLAAIDFYFMSLGELKSALVGAARKALHRAPAS